ncbi:CobW family GTP-binding protein [Chloroflexus sp.]|uniref:CobW family GTP-binding protein n=1 Tax=Chloroflexus sp. TaxID=1904827 RepID=UPI002ADE470C|nr:CobW family GTP-binding protein [Chloroflexus sp.]
MPMENNAPSIPVTIISGFLGSGKTTLLRRLLSRGDQRIGVIVNEFGTLGIDGELLAQSDAGPLIELNGGCVCCVAGSDLLLALETLLASGPLTAIAIETSGLAEPGALIRQLRAADIPLDTLVTLVSAVDYEQAMAASPLTLRQIHLADLLLITHSDLVSAQTIAQISEQLRTINRRAPLVPIVQGDVPPTLIFSPRYDGTLPAESPHLHDEFAVTSWQSDLPLQRTALEQTLRRLAADGIFRAKGIVYCTDSPWADEVHLVAGRWTLSALRLSAQPRPLCRLTLIGRAAALEPAANALDSCIDSDERITRWQQRLTGQM